MDADNAQEIFDLESEIEFLESERDDAFDLLDEAENEIEWWQQERYRAEETIDNIQAEIRSLKRRLEALRDGKVFDSADPAQQDVFEQADGNSGNPS